MQQRQMHLKFNLRDLGCQMSELPKAVKSVGLLDVRLPIAKAVNGVRELTLPLLNALALKKFILSRACSNFDRSKAVDYWSRIQ